jgi:hypothetical protein
LESFCELVLSDDLTLGASPSTNPASDWSRLKVFVAVSAFELFYGAYDTYLLMELAPIKAQGSIRILQQLQ